MTNDIAIHWFRQDLRLSDNPSLCYAAEQGRVLPIYIYDEINAGEYSPGAASRWWLHHSLSALNKSLEGRLRVYRGDANEILTRLTQKHKINAVSWNRCYEPWRVLRDKSIKSTLTENGVVTKSFNGSLLWEPWNVLKTDGTPYKVFTPFYRKRCLTSTPPRRPMPKPKSMSIAGGKFDALTIDGLNLLPGIPWAESFVSHWAVSEHGAQQALNLFLQNGIGDYKEGRNFPAKQCVSRLSPFLHWGEISPNQIWYDVQSLGHGTNEDHMQSELAWREFSHSQLYYFPGLPGKNLQSKFDTFPWINDKDKLRSWQQGMTGYPIVDAGMRELWQTGYMHNRVRMIVGSFLVKNLLIHWHCGAAWFWDCLLDADLANNSASWQWIAGCGADAAPYFRIFNPVTQGEKFDTSGQYTRRYVPELKHMPEKYLFKPWLAPQPILDRADVELGKSYPLPIVDLKTSREQALDAYKRCSNTK